MHVNTFARSIVAQQDSEDLLIYTCKEAVPGTTATF